MYGLIQACQVMPKGQHQMTPGLENVSVSKRWEAEDAPVDRIRNKQMDRDS